jgi:hypothetical protein
MSPSAKRAGQTGASGRTRTCDPPLRDGGAWSTHAYPCHSRRGEQGFRAPVQRALARELRPKLRPWRRGVAISSESRTGHKSHRPPRARGAAHPRLGRRLRRHQPRPDPRRHRIDELSFPAASRPRPAPIHQRSDSRHDNPPAGCRHPRLESDQPTSSRGLGPELKPRSAAVDPRIGHGNRLNGCLFRDTETGMIRCDRETRRLVELEGKTPWPNSSRSLRSAMSVTPRRP